MDDDYLTLEWTSLLGPDDDPSWADWQKIWKAEAEKSIARTKDCLRRMTFCMRMSKKADGHDEHL
jgi:hypothetical protein